MFSILKKTNLFVFEYGIRIRVCKITPESEFNLIRINNTENIKEKFWILYLPIAKLYTTVNSCFVADCFIL